MRLIVRKIRYLDHMAVAEFLLHVCSLKFKIPVLNNDASSPVGFFFFCPPVMLCDTKQLIVPYWTKLFGHLMSTL